MLAQSILPEFDQEMANTRKTLERVSDEHFDWRPHPKSYTMGELASHIANLPVWTGHTIQGDSFDVAPEGSAANTAPEAVSRAQLLETFDTNVAAARAAIAGASDETLLASWSLLAGGRTLFSLPRIAVLRSFVLNHGIHHRAQLSVYLRMNDLPVPALYGPSADESAM